MTGGGAYCNENFDVNIHGISILPVADEARHPTPRLFPIDYKCDETTRAGAELMFAGVTGM
jgi:hypothetical protein